jgi:hypothetical protein
MKNSNDYIKMCSKASELQSLWSPAIGDKFISKESSDSDSPQIFTLIQIKYFPNNIIWLPSQEELQKFVINDYKDKIDLMNAVLDFVQAEHITSMSMDQYWLTFVMKYKFNKIWNKEDWVLVNK